MADREPGFLDILDALLPKENAGSGEEFKCEKCDNEAAVIVLRCACSFKLAACLPCSIVTWDGLTVLMNEHREECGTLRTLIRISEDRR